MVVERRKAARTPAGITMNSVVEGARVVRAINFELPGKFLTKPRVGGGADASGQPVVIYS